MYPADRRSEDRGIRILHVIETLGRGGAEQALASLVKKWHSQGWEVDVAALWPPYILKEELQSACGRVFCLDLSHRWSVFEGLRKMHRLLAHRHYDVLHAHLFFSEFYVGLTKLWCPAIKRIATFHNLGYANFPPTSWYLQIRKYLDTLIKINCFDGFSAVSKAVATQFEKDIGITGIKIIPNPLAAGLFTAMDPALREATRREADIPPQAFVVTLAGRMAWEKGHAVFFKALEILTQEPGAPIALIIGEGPLEEDLRTMVKTLRLGEVVRFLGRLPQERLFTLVRASDVFIQPSLFEGFGLAAAEAMALGTPVIASAAQGLSEIIVDGQTGLLFPVGDAQALANAVLKLRKDPALRESLSRQGRTAVQQQFNLDTIGSTWWGFYQQVVHG